MQPCPRFHGVIYIDMDARSRYSTVTSKFRSLVGDFGFRDDIEDGTAGITCR
jgi:hypothetical protein